MARFYGAVTGKARTSATREGSQDSGITSHTRGWDTGIEVQGRVDVVLGDVFDVYVTGGSHNANKRTMIGSLVGTEWIPAGKEVNL